MHLNRDQMGKFRHIFDSDQEGGSMYRCVGLRNASRISGRPAERFERGIIFNARMEKQGVAFLSELASIHWDSICSANRRNEKRAQKIRSGRIVVCGCRSCRSLLSSLKPRRIAAFGCYFLRKLFRCTQRVPSAGAHNRLQQNGSRCHTILY